MLHEFGVKNSFRGIFIEEASY